MALIEFQKISNGELPRGGKAYVGVYGSNEPESNPVTVYSDYLLQDAIVSSSGIDLDSDGFPLLNGQRVSLYVAVDHSFMIRDSVGARFWSEAQQRSIPSSGGGFDPSQDQNITGEYSFEVELGKSFTIIDSTNGYVSSQIFNHDPSVFADGVIDRSIVTAAGNDNRCGWTSQANDNGPAIAKVFADDGLFTIASFTVSISSGIPVALIEGRLSVDSSQSGTTLGSVTNKIEVFDEGGSSLGFIPVYDSIT